MHRIFVYGTLKRGQPNHHLITGEHYGKAEYVGEGRTVEKWPLVVATQYNIPLLLDAKGTGKRVHGEIYDIDDDTLKEFDILEQHPHGYTRKVMQVELVGTGNQATGPQITDCQTYVICDFAEPLLELPFKENYDDGDEIAKSYSKAYETAKNLWVQLKK